MIADVDEVLRRLLVQEIDIKGNEVDIVFDMPKREWSSRLSKPTINLFLYERSLLRRKCLVGDLFAPFNFTLRIFPPTNHTCIRRVEAI